MSKGSLIFAYPLRAIHKRTLSLQNILMLGTSVDDRRLTTPRHQ